MRIIARKPYGNTLDEVKDVVVRGLVDVAPFAVVTGVAFQYGGFGYAVAALTGYTAGREALRLARRKKQDDLRKMSLMARKEKRDFEFGEVFRAIRANEKESAA